MPKTLIAVCCCLLLCNVAAAQANGSMGRPAQGAPAERNAGFNLPHRFSVEIDGVSVAGVHTLSDLNAIRQDAAEVQSPRDSQTPANYKDGEDAVNRTRPGNHKPGKLILTKDWSNTLDWYQWRKAVIDGKTDRRSISIIFHDDAGVEVGRMNFYNCWPVKHTLPSLAEQRSGDAVETMELSYDWVEWRPR